IADRIPCVFQLMFPRSKLFVLLHAVFHERFGRHFTYSLFSLLVLFLESLLFVLDRQLIIPISLRLQLAIHPL
ncbi:hypothetical protein PENTCL1PPCAC_10069, partial [Pristionchus entomophagus]